MRLGGAGSLYNPSNANPQARDASASADCSVTTMVVGEKSLIVNTTGNSGTTVGNSLQIHWAVDADL